MKVRSKEDKNKPERTGCVTDVSDDGKAIRVRWEDGTVSKPLPVDDHELWTDPVASKRKTVNVCWDDGEVEEIIADDYHVEVKSIDVGKSPEEIKASLDALRDFQDREKPERTAEKIALDRKVKGFQAQLEREHRKGYVAETRASCICTHAYTPPPLISSKLFPLQALML